MYNIKRVAHAILNSQLLITYIRKQFSRLEIYQKIREKKKIKSFIHGIKQRRNKIIENNAIFDLVIVYYFFFFLCFYAIQTSTFNAHK